MHRELIHIYGPFSINSYGVAIAIGIIVFMLLAVRNPRRKQLMSANQFSESILVGILAGIIGGRLLFILTSWHMFATFGEFFSIWDGGFAVLGTILAIILAVPLNLKKQLIPILPFLDLVGLYAPLLYAISRIGCFAAGCCYGLPTSLPWGYIYSDPDSIAPLHVALHPTQLYSSGISLLVFFFMIGIAQRIFKNPGQLFMIYLALTSSERFIVDFWRADREYLSQPAFALLSVYQWIALGIFFSSLIGFFIVSSRKR